MSDRQAGEGVGVHAPPRPCRGLGRTHEGRWVRLPPVTHELKRRRVVAFLSYYSHMWLPCLDKLRGDP